MNNITPKLVLIYFINTIYGYHTTTRTLHRNLFKSKNTLQVLPTSFTIAVGDYAAEIEKATGTELYGPIMRAGVILFISGFISAFIAAFIISKSDSWDGLVEEFDRGKEAQLIDMNTSSNDQNEKNKSKESSGGENVSDEIKNLDF